MLKNHSHFLSKFWIKAESTHNGESCVCEVLIYLSKKGEISLLVNCAIEYILAFLLQFCRESFPTAPILWHGIFHKIFHNYIELCTEKKHSNKIRNLAHWVWHTVLTSLWPFDCRYLSLFGCAGSLSLRVGFLRLWQVGAPLELWGVGFSFWWPLSLQSTGSGALGL